MKDTIYDKDGDVQKDPFGPGYNADGERVIERPVPFAGTAEEAERNVKTHRWAREPDGEVLCWDCESKPWHAAARYPCGTHLKRETAVVTDPPGLHEMHPGMFPIGWEPSKLS